MSERYMAADSLPLAFWACLLVLLLLIAYGLHQHRKPWAMPCLAVAGTVMFWYLGDILYTGVGNLSNLFAPDIVNRALGQVVIFSVAYGAMVNEVARWFSADKEEYIAYDELRAGLESGDSQKRVIAALWFVTGVWTLLFLITQVLNGFPVIPFLFPPLAGYQFSPWSRGRVGGAFDFLRSTGYFVHIFVCAVFGALFALARRQYPKIVAGIMIVLSWPFWMFGRRRNPLLAIGIPLVAGYLLFSRHSKTTKAILIAVLFLCASFWFKVILGTRTRGVTETVVAVAKGEDVGRSITAERHLGLDMFKELCYMNTFLDKGVLSVNWGRGYFSEAVNLIPRRFWKDKPYLGFEYSLARGFRRRSGGDLVECMITPGVIGQGVRNFGFFLGPVAAAFLMALWSSILARLWLQRESVLRASMFLLGLGLTFNAGRNLTLQVFFPFLFGYGLLRLYEVYEKHHGLGIVPKPQ